MHSGNVAVVRAVQPLNALLPTDVQALNVAVVSDMQLLNASLPTDVQDSTSSLMATRLELPLKVFAGIANVVLFPVKSWSLPSTVKVVKSLPNKVL